MFCSKAKFERVRIAGRGYGKARFGVMGNHELNDITSPVALAVELGHVDYAQAIRRFLRKPDDGRAPFSDHLFREHWRLTPEQAERIRERFS